MDADGWRRILTFNSFGQSSTNICIALANVAKKSCVEQDQNNSPEAFLVSRLIPLDKNHGLRPIRVGEVIRRIISKSVVHTLKKDIIRAVGNLQVCAGHESGCEVAIHAMSQIFNKEDSEAVLLIDAFNAFNTVDRKLFLHNVSVICPEIAVLVRNCYSLPSRLFIIGGSELKSCEGTTQRAPATMVIYAIAISLLLMLVDQAEKLPGKRNKSVTYADDFTGADSIKNLLHWWNILTTLGPLFGYHPEPTKCWLIVKPCMKGIALKTFENTDINMTEDGMCHLGAVIGTIEYRKHYVTQKVNNWLDELNMLCDIAGIEPQAAYSCFVSGYKHKLPYIMRTIPDISHQLERIDALIGTKFIPAITGGIYVNPDKHYLLSLLAKNGGLGLPIFSELADIEFQYSNIMSENLQNKIIEQEQASSQQHDKKIKEIKNNI